MKKILSFILLFFILIVQSQNNEIKSQYIAVYDISYQYNKKNNKEEMLLFMNPERGESFYECTNSYVLDSLITQGKLSAEDMGTIAYGSNFNEKVYNKNSQLTVYEKIVNAKVVYHENPQIKWTITNETKMHGEIKVTKAYANAFGRKWYAWYADNGLPFGPYKFVGLPGLIVEIEDANKEFNLQLLLLKKKIKTRYLPKTKNYIPIQKNQIEKTRYGQKVLRMSTIVIHKDPKEKRKWREGLEKRFKQYPRLDIQYPYQP